MRTLVFALGIAAGLAAQPATQAATPYVEPLVGKLFQTAAAEAAPLSVDCASVAVNIYFERNDPALTNAAQTTLDIVGDRMRGCNIAAVSIETPADAVATPEGRKLAGMRGAALLKAISARGLAPGAVVISEQATDEPASAETPQHVRLAFAMAPGESRAARAAGAAPKLPNNEI